MISYIGKTASLYWIGAQISAVMTLSFGSEGAIGMPSFLVSVYKHAHLLCTVVIMKYIAVNMIKHWTLSTHRLVKDSLS